MFFSWVIDTIKVQTSFKLVALQHQLHKCQCEQFDWEQRKELTVCLGSTNIFFCFHFLCLIWHVIKRYGRELSTVQRRASNSQRWWLMELWHFEFLEGGPKIQKSAKNRRTLDLSILVLSYFAPAPSSVRAQFFSARALEANGPPDPSFFRPRPPRPFVLFFQRSHW